MVYVPKRGIIIHEPSVVAVSYTDKKVLAVGKEAKDMLGRTPDTIIARRPLKDGVIADYRTTEAMLRYFITKLSEGSAIPTRGDDCRSCRHHVYGTSRLTPPCRRGKSNYIIKSPSQPLLGQIFPIGSASGHMIVDIGGGTSEIAVISLGGIVANTSVRIGGNNLMEP